MYLLHLGISAKLRFILLYIFITIQVAQSFLFLDCKNWALEDKRSSVPPTIFRTVL